MLQRLSFAALRRSNPAVAAAQRHQLPRTAACFTAVSRRGCASDSGLATSSASAQERAARERKAADAALEEAWAEEAKRITVVPPPHGSRPKNATTVIDGIEVSDQERRARTREFLDLISDPDTTTRQTARDMVYAAVKTHRTLRPHHLERVVARAPAIHPHDRGLTRALTIVTAAMDAADEADLPFSEFAADDHVLNLMLHRLTTAVLGLASPLLPGRGPDELVEIVGGSHATEPQWWLAARMEARGVPITHVQTLDMLERSASRSKRLFGASQAVRANRIEYIERARRELEGLQGGGPAAPAQQQQHIEPPSREPSPAMRQSE